MSNGDRAALVIILSATLVLLIVLTVAFTRTRDRVTRLEDRVTVLEHQTRP